MQSAPVPEPLVLTASGADDVTRLYKYFSLLRRVAHPGVVEVAQQRFGATSGELHLTRVDGLAFADTHFPTLKDLANCVTALAVTVAHLHDRQIAHGALTGHSIMVWAVDHRPVIMDFTNASPLESPAQAAEDVAAVGALLTSKLPAVIDPIRAKINGDDDHATMLAGLARLAKNATTPDLDRRPTARQLATDLRRLAGPEPGPVRRRRRFELSSLAQHKRKLLTGAGVLLAASLIAVAGVYASSRPEPQQQMLVAAPIQRACAERAAGDVVADIDGDGCGDSIRFDNGRVIVNGTAFEAAQPGDVFTVGRWKAGAPRTLAVLRPSTGRVYVFDAWPEGDTSLSPRTVANVRGGNALSLLPRADGTDDLRVTTDDGRTVDVDAAVTANDPTTTTPRGRR